MLPKRTAGMACAMLFATQMALGEISIVVDESAQTYTVTDDGRPVLRYNFGTVLVPEGVTGKYAVARSDYVHPIYGPDGEILTKDYSPDHPHHRGVYWAWPEVRYQGELGDLHALQVVFARPVKVHRAEATTTGAMIEAENVWKWKDETPIVNERVVIHAYREQNGERAIDFHFRFEALEEGVTLARRKKNTYGGLNIRLSKLKGQAFLYRGDPPSPWGLISGIPPEGKAPVGFVILQNASNPGFPGDWAEYPKIDWLQPTFPKAGTEWAPEPGKPLTLSYRIVITKGTPDEKRLSALWREYNKASAKETK